MDQEDYEGEPSVEDISDVPGLQQGNPNKELEKLLVFKVYKRRWFVLFVLCLLNCSNAVVSQSINCVALSLASDNPRRPGIFQSTHCLWCKLSHAVFLKLSGSLLRSDSKLN